MGESVKVEVEVLVEEFMKVEVGWGGGVREGVGGGWVEEFVKE